MGNFDIHQWLFSGIRNPVVVFKIHEWIYSTLIILVSTSGFLVKLKTLYVVVFKMHDWIYFTLLILVSISGFILLG